MYLLIKRREGMAKKKRDKIRLVGLQTRPWIREQVIAAAKKQGITATQYVLLAALSGDPFYCNKDNLYILGKEEPSRFL